MGLRDENIGKLEEEAQKRKERLKLLKRKRTKSNSDQDENSNADDLPGSQVLFRNYQPLSEKLEEAVLPQSEPGNIDDLVKKQLTEDQTIKEITHVEMSNLAPKKVNFDIRRGIESQLLRLEKRTDKAIAELIRDKLKEGRQQDFLLTLNAGVSMQRRTAVDSDDD